MMGVITSVLKTVPSAEYAAGSASRIQYYRKIRTAAIPQIDNDIQTILAKIVRFVASSSFRISGSLSE